MKYAKIPDESAGFGSEAGSFNFDDSFSDASDESSDGEESEAEREQKLSELSNQVGFSVAFGESVEIKRKVRALYEKRKI